MNDFDIDIFTRLRMYTEGVIKFATSLLKENTDLRVRVKELEVELAKLQDKINPPKAHYERP